MLMTFGDCEAIGTGEISDLTIAVGSMDGFMAPFDSVRL
jgi:hypothetical protein